MVVIIIDSIIIIIIVIIVISLSLFYWSVDVMNQFLLYVPRRIFPVKNQTNKKY